MLTVICETPGLLRAEERPRPVRADDEVLVRVKRVGVCGTDLHIYTGKQPYLSYPRVMGHELSGLVEEAPEGSALQPGDVVYVMPYLSCGHCIACRAGKTNCCTRIQVLGVHRDGAFTEYLSVPQAFVHRADGVTLDQAAIRPLVPQARDHAAGQPQRHHRGFRDRAAGHACWPDQGDRGVLK